VTYECSPSPHQDNQTRENLFCPRKVVKREERWPGEAELRRFYRRSAAAREGGEPVDYELGEGEVEGAGWSDEDDGVETEVEEAEEAEEVEEAELEIEESEEEGDEMDVDDEDEDDEGGAGGVGVEIALF
jgi:hypothetical protein